MNRARMKSRFLLSLLAALALASAVRSAPLTRELREASVRYVSSMQNADGGYRASASVGNSQLANTLVAVRAIHYFGGKVAQPRRVVIFVKDRFDPVSGAFRERRTADVRGTAMGLMTLVELK